MTAVPPHAHGPAAASGRRRPRPPRAGRHRARRPSHPGRPRLRPHRRRQPRDARRQQDADRATTAASCWASTAITRRTRPSRIAHAGGKTETQELTITQRTFDIQRINNLPKNQVEPNAEELKRIKAEQVRINAARARDSDLPYAFEGFDWPALGPISGVYGSQRILNGEPRSPHFGVDVAAPLGTPLKAPAGGIVSLADADLFFTGGTIIIDHGHGLASLFAHMQKVAVKEGDSLAKGGYVGNLGRTGRATGPHLHWGMFLFSTPIDPQLLVPPMPS